MQKMLTMILITALVGIILAPLQIYFLRRLKLGQTIRPDGPQTHLIKAGTPTMGGFIIWSALVLAMLLSGMTGSPLTRLLLVVFGHVALGFLDDYIKSVRKDPEGLSPRWKLLGQLLLSLYFYLALLRDGAQSLFIPLFGIDLYLGFLYPVFVILYMVFFSNAVNFADGIDGLCGGLTLISSLLCMFFALRQGDIELASFAAALCGGIVAFLCFNLHPARIFMGDTGSLGLGAAIAAMSLLLRQELLMLLAGFLFIVEMLSVILQVSYFKYTRRRYGSGRRIFRMAPFHHHLEQLGWSEWRVVILFWGLACLSASLAYLMA
ncbi:MAG: phospho-N-acetylmuramoyl-pentapeptide-transferase [Symbiobacteriaceae bacterium]|nr:phospho-N-acetylmuramoyl-pentapeptide-transferase [Symbiobacteriaceae bacterium]